MSVLFFFISYLKGEGVFCQSADKYELQKELVGATDSKKRVDLLNLLSLRYLDFDDTVSFFYAQRALHEALQAEYAKGLKYSYSLVGWGYMNLGNYAMAKANYRHSQSIVAIGANEEEAFNYNLIGNFYQQIAKFDSAEYNYSQSRKLLRLGDKNLPKVYRNLGALNLLRFKNEVAEAYLDSASAALPGQPNNSLQLSLWNFYGQLYHSKGEFGKAKDYIEKMRVLSAQTEDHYHAIQCLINQADLASETGDFIAMLRYCFEALKKIEYYNYPPQHVMALLQTGEAYSLLGQYDLATRYFFKALRISESMHLDFETAFLYSELGWVYKDEGNYPLALHYADRSQQLREQMGDQKGVANNHNLRGIVYNLQKKYHEAIKEHEKALSIRKEINNNSGISASLFNLSLVYKDLGFSDVALELQLKALAMDEKIGDIPGMGISFNELANLYIQRGNLKEAEAYLLKAEEIASQTKSKRMARDNAGFFSMLKEKQADLKQALEYKKRYQLLNDSLYSEVSTFKSLELEALYEVDKREQQIKLLSAEKKLRDDQLTMQRIELRQKGLIIWASVIGSVLLLLTLLIALQYYWSQRKANRRLLRLNKEILEQKEEIQSQTEEIQEANDGLIELNREIIEKNEEIQSQSEELMEANQTISSINKNLECKVEARTLELKQAYKELDTFFYRSSHDFRRPITTFLGLAEVAKITVKDPSALELFEKVSETASNLDKMLHKLQSISDLGMQQLIQKEVLLKELASGILDSFREEVQRKNIRVLLELDLAIPFVSYPALIKIILENLIENSIYFEGPVDPMLKINAYFRGADLLIAVQDNGQGIRQEFQSRLFEMYFRANERSKGNGLGLYIVKKAIDKLNGTISVKSEFGEGSLFEICIPNTPAA